MYEWTANDNSQDFSRLSLSRNPKLGGAGYQQQDAPGRRGDSSDECEQTVVEAKEQNADEPYAQLIYRALMSVPNHSMMLQEIYQWFRVNTGRSSADTKGWMNSIRHNLSMNAAFKKTEQKDPRDDTKNLTGWVLEPFAIREGVQSTTRYRKVTGAKKFIKTIPEIAARTRTSRLRQTRGPRPTTTRRSNGAGCYIKHEEGVWTGESGGGLGKFCAWACRNETHGIFFCAPDWED